MDPKTVIDGLVREIARGDDLPDFPTWPQIKDHLAGCGLLSMDALECWRGQIRETLLRCKLEQIEEERQRTGQKVQTNEATPLTPPRSRTPSNSEGSDKALEPKKEEPFRPTLDDVANKTNPGVLSIYLETKNRWEGAACQHCLQDWSYMSSRWMNRHNLEIVDGRIWLTWRPNDHSETYVTQFVVIEGLACDFMLGRKSMDEEFNRREIEKAETEKASAGPISNPTSGYHEQLNGSLTHSRPQHRGPGADEVDLLGKLILSVARNSKIPQLPYTNPYMPPQGQVAEDGRSVSTDQDRHAGDTSPFS